MTMKDRAELISTMVDGIADSVTLYEDAKTNHTGWADLSADGHTRTSIQRRITVAREELMKLYKTL